MALLLTDKWEHALLAAIVEEAGKSQPKGYLGRTAIQKIAYFLKVVGVPMRYRFDLYHYGPYCDTISQDVEWLRADRVIEDKSADRGKYSNYRPGENAQELFALHAGELTEYRPTIHNVVKALLPLEPEHLELVATLDYVFRQLKATKDGKPRKEEVLKRFVEVKGDKFESEMISSAYESMVSAGLLRC